MTESTRSPDDSSADILREHAAQTSPQPSASTYDSAKGTEAHRAVYDGLAEALQPIVARADQRVAKSVTVYVRKGADDNERRISFQRPPGIPTSALLDRGIAIDGNQGVFSVDPVRTDYERISSYHDPIGGQYHNSLPEALAEAEKELLRFLAQHGYEAVFA